MKGFGQREEVTKKFVKSAGYAVIPRGKRSEAAGSQGKGHFPRRRYSPGMATTE